MTPYCQPLNDTVYGTQQKAANTLKHKEDDDHNIY